MFIGRQDIHFLERLIVDCLLEKGAMWYSGDDAVVGCSLWEGKVIGSSAILLILAICLMFAVLFV